MLIWVWLCWLHILLLGFCVLLGFSEILLDIYILFYCTVWIVCLWGVLAGIEGWEKGKPGRWWPVSYWWHRRGKEGWYSIIVQRRTLRIGCGKTERVKKVMFKGSLPSILIGLACGWSKVINTETVMGEKSGQWGMVCGIHRGHGHGTGTATACFLLQPEGAPFTYLFLNEN